MPENTLHNTILVGVDTKCKTIQTALKYVALVWFGPMNTQPPIGGGMGKTDIQRWTFNLFLVPHLFLALGGSA